MNLTKNTYFSTEAETEYFSASQIKSFTNCQAQALAEIRGVYKRPESSSLMVGSYVDAFFEGSMPDFTAKHPEIFNSRTGELKAEYRKADEMINRASKSDVFMHYTEGEKQKIITGEIDGFPFKAKMDFYVPGKRIVDLKTAKDLAPIYKEGCGRLNPIEYWGWALQLAIYQALEGNKLRCYLAVITKEDPCDLRIIQIPQYVLDTELTLLREKLPLYDALKSGVVEPERCEHCAYCRGTRKVEVEEYNPED